MNANAALRQEQEHVASSVMQFSIDRAALLKALGHVQSVVERRGTIPILSNLKLEAGNGELELTATDMDIAIVDHVAARVEASGAVTLPAHMFYEIVRKLPEGSEVSLKSNPEKNSVTISAGHSRFSLATLPVDEFPTMAEGDLAHTFVLSGKECLNLIERTRFAMSSEETRYYLNGVYLHAVESGQDSFLRAVATDGHRLARVEVALPAGASGMPGVIVPRKTIGELVKLLEESLSEVKISLSETKIRFVCGKAVLVSKLIDGNYPDYERVIPAGNDKPMEVGAKVLAEAVDRVSVVSAEKARGVKFSLDKGALNLSASSPDQGTAQESLEATYASDVIEVGFNARYLLDVLSHIEGDNVQFMLADAAAPAILRDSAFPGALFVVMPMRV